MPAVGSGRTFPDGDEALRLYEALVRARRVETRTVELYRLGAIVGGCYTAIGNEATSVGMAWPMAASDVLVPTHRDLGAHLVRGHDVREIARQYLKRDTSQTHGRDSGLHLGREGSGIVGMISHLAHMMPVAAGVALAEQMAGRDTSVVTTVGDGSTSLGDFHETLNFIALRRLPVVVVIVNNQYAYATPTTLQYATERLSDRAAGYGMVGETIDGTDVVRVMEAVGSALDRGRRGQGPTLLEARTMRMRGHSEHDDFKYVPPELLDAWQRWDPVARLRQAIIDRDRSDVATLDALEQRVAAEVGRAFEEALGEPEPAAARADADVYRAWSPDWTAPSGSAWALPEDTPWPE